MHSRLKMREVLLLENLLIIWFISLITQKYHDHGSQSQENDAISNMSSKKTLFDLHTRSGRALLLKKLNYFIYCTVQNSPHRTCQCVHPFRPVQLYKSDCRATPVSIPVQYVSNSLDYPVHCVTSQITTSSLWGVDPARNADSDRSV